VRTVRPTARTPTHRRLSAAGRPAAQCQTWMPQVPARPWKSQVPAGQPCARELPVREPLVWQPLVRERE